MLLDPQLVPTAQAEPSLVECVMASGIMLFAEGLEAYGGAKNLPARKNPMHPLQRMTLRWLLNLFLKGETARKNELLAADLRAMLKYLDARRNPDYCVALQVPQKVTARRTLHQSQLPRFSQN